MLHVGHVVMQRSLQSQVAKCKANGGMKTNAALLGKSMRKLLGNKYADQTLVTELRDVITVHVSTDLAADLAAFDKMYASTFHVDPLQLCAALEKAEACQACAELLKPLCSSD